VTNQDIDKVLKTLLQLNHWIEQEEFKGYDPYDALNSTLLKRLTFGNRRIGQVWVQLMKRSPINVRPLLGGTKGYNPKGMGLFLASYWRLYRHFGQAEDFERVRFFANWLQNNIAHGYHGACWGYNFDWPNRGFFAPAGTPTIVNTVFIGLAFIDLLALPDPAGIVDWGDMPLEIARSACEFIMRDLWSDRPAPDEQRFSYTPLDQRCVHNANLLGAWLLAEVGVRSKETQLTDTALRAVRYTVRRQRTDGSWRYGEGSNDGWVDNFHTGYVLVALKRIAQLLDTHEFDQAIEQGYAYWTATMFLTDGTPKYYADRVFPIDTHCVAQGILTYLEFADRDPQATELARRLATWGIANLQDPVGYFHYQIHQHYRIRIPYMRWTQAWMQRGLTELITEKIQ